MGWAKYYEDNLSIMQDRLDRDTYKYKYKYEYEYVKPVSKMPIVKQHVVPAQVAVLIKTTEASKQTGLGRRGIEVSFSEALEEKAIKKLQLNGWWWSKSRARWCNLDTVFNRKYIETKLKAFAPTISVCIA